MKRLAFATSMRVLLPDSFPCKGLLCATHFLQDIPLRHFAVRLNQDVTYALEPEKLGISVVSALVLTSPLAEEARDDALNKSCSTEGIQDLVT